MNTTHYRVYVLLFLVTAITSFTNSSMAQSSDQTLPTSFKNFPLKATCEAWSTGISGSSTLTGEVQIDVQISDESLVNVSSKTKELNFAFGQRFVSGDRTSDRNFCSYFYDEFESRGLRTIKYFCSYEKESSWLDNEYSSIVFDYANSGSYVQLCKSASYRGRNNCWKLKNCR